MTEKATADHASAESSALYMLRVRGRVARGHIVVDDAVDLPEGAELELVVVDEAWPPELDAELERRLAHIDDGDAVDAAEVIARLRAPR